MLLRGMSRSSFGMSHSCLRSVMEKNEIEMAYRLLDIALPPFSIPVFGYGEKDLGVMGKDEVHLVNKR